jgi:glutamate--cysteine ligase
VFPEVRLKKVLEMRGADAVPPGLTCSLPAFWKGLLYDAQSLAAAWERVRIHPLAAREARAIDVARRGLAARYGDEPVLELARDLTQLARDGLRRLGHAGRRDADETGFLDPVFEQLALGKSPGQAVFERWEGDWHRSVDRLIEYARY